MEVRHILALYEQAELTLLAKVSQYTLSEADASEADDDTWLAQKLQNIRQLRNDTAETLRTLKTLDKPGQDALIQAYLAGAQTHSSTFIQTNSAAVNKLVGAYQRSLQNTRLHILRSTEDAYRRIVVQAAAQTVVGTDTRLAAAKRALNTFADAGITGFVDDAGRQWDMTSYVEMATRTLTNNAFREGRLAGLADTDQDLIIVRAGPNHCPLCDPWQNQILSISGKDRQYPSLAEAQGAGLYHPNCKCSLAQYTQGLTKIDTPREQDKFEETQQQRYLERQLRAWKRRDIVGDDRAKEKIKEYRSRIKDLTESENLVRKKNRESIVQAR